MTGEAPRKMGVTGGREGAGWARMGRARAGRTLGVVVTGARTLGVTAPPVCSKYVIIKKNSLLLHDRHACNDLSHAGWHYDWLLTGLDQADAGRGQGPGARAHPRPSRAQRRPHVGAHCGDPAKYFNDCYRIGQTLNSMTLVNLPPTPSERPTNKM